VAHVLRKARLTRATGATGAVTLIQRFGSALNLNIHFHMLVLDGAYLSDTEPPAFRRIAPPREAELQTLVERLAERVGRSLERQGLLVRDTENEFLEFGPAAGGAMDDLIGHSITYRVAMAIERLALTAQGQVRYRLKTPYRDGTTHIVLEPMDFMARLAAMTWARRLQRVFGIDLERCARCGGRLTVIASIEEPALIARILAHRRERGAEDPPVASLGARAPPPEMSGMLF
jgi:hypothetical protein